ncbi:MAG: sugar transferase [Candidatus Latescibacteria bacterium]|nr:sugar transferase [Candidatus Latescibacterota bacterium]
MKRVLDVIVSATALVLLLPVLLVVALVVWGQDFRSPIYLGCRVGRGGRPFKMVKFRSMAVGADRTGVLSTAATDNRITSVGRFLRAYKLDELTQLVNVLTGDMSLVGPRPQVRREVEIYTDVECDLLKVKPGITDLSSIVFSDEGDILKDKADPDLAYNQLIRPWKSRLGLLYVEKRSLLLDFKLIFLTTVALVSRKKALQGVQRVLERLGADGQIKRVALRNEKLIPFPPPGATEIVTQR